MLVILESICTPLDALEVMFCTIQWLHKEKNLINFVNIFMVLVGVACYW